MKKRIIFALLCWALLLAACGAPAKQAEAPAQAPETAAAEDTTAAAEVTEAAPTEETQAAEAEALEDGVYTVDFDTDSAMFHINESLDGKGTLTVEGGKMTVHITLVSKSILKLFPGSAEEAKQDGAALLEPTLDPVTYKDGYKEEVYGFDVPVEVIGQDFPLALIGKKGTWYDHTVRVSNPIPVE